MKYSVFLIGAVSALTFDASAVNAQSVNPIDHCRENAGGEKERIACLEEAIISLMNRQQAPADDVAGRSASAPQIADARAPDTTKSHEATKDGNQPAGLGAEQVIRRRIDNGEIDRDEQDKEDRIIARISDFARTDAGFFVIFLDNGQIWRQRKSDAAFVRLSKHREYDAEIYKGVFSGYRMKIPRAHKTLRVERIK